MDTFVKTFVVCLIISLAFLFYKFFGHESHSKELQQVNKTVYSVQKNENSIEKAQEIVKKEQKTNLEQTIATHTCFFYDSQGKLVPVTREVKGSDAVKSAILILLKGPLIIESKKGIYTEIPPNVDLIGVESDDKKVIVNLTSNFGNGGGFDSVEHRIKQLSQTVKTVAPSKSVYLHIDGKQVEYLGGDGVYVKQPLE